MYALENAKTRIVINPLGAELLNLAVDGAERLWQGDPAYWGRRSPVLFPVVGKCKNDQLLIDGVFYAMPQHGFARDLVFEAANIKSNSVAFCLFETGQTLQQFPFAFELNITYTLLKSGVHVHYRVSNSGNRPMPFALGAHPAFLLPESGFQQLSLAFSEQEELNRHLLSKGLFNGETASLGKGMRLNLSEELFDHDAIVLKNLKSRRVKLTGANNLNLEMQFDGFGDFGIWTKPACDKFICLEPWFGHADTAATPNSETLRSGLHLLEPGKVFEAFWQVEFNT